MSKLTDRRKFLKQSVAAGVAAVAGAITFPNFGIADAVLLSADIAVAHGNKPFDNARNAVELLGGMKKFVSKKNRVGLIVNSVFGKKGSYTNPEVTLAVIRMCLDAGAKEIYTLDPMPDYYWNRSSLSSKYRDEIAKLKASGEKVKVDIGKGKSLKQAEVSKMLLECDVIINIPIIKHHVGTGYTGNLKNMMGACSEETCRYFHYGSGVKGGYEDVGFLSQCIADVNLVRPPDLCVVDATEILTTNGPAGPGEIKKPGKVIAGTKCASVDAYCVTILGLNPMDVAAIRNANAHGLGEINLKKLVVKNA
jgi:uncharacterized protein (DUF362 family)